MLFTLAASPMVYSLYFLAERSSKTQWLVIVSSTRIDLAMSRSSFLSKHPLRVTVSMHRDPEFLSP